MGTTYQTLNNEEDKILGRLYHLYTPNTSEHISLFTNICPVCGTKNYLLLVRKDWTNWNLGTYIQDAFDYLDADDREIIKTGTHPDCWDSLFPVEDDGYAE